MGLGAIKVQNIATNMRPTKTVADVAIADQALTVSNAAVAMIATTLNPLTTHVMWTLDGDAARFTLDGTNPTASVGHYVAANSSGIWHRETAEAAKWIRTTTDANLHISEMVM